MTPYLIGKAQILDMHTYVVERYGGRFGIASSDTLDAVLALPTQVVFGELRYGTPIAQIAALVYGLVRRQPFVSHNETTALLTLLYWCDNHGYQLDATHSALVAVIMELYQQRSEEPLQQWLHDHLIPHADHTN
ncbi:MAG: hypothetical protein RL076_1318 [Chloroflexota bacterium]